jgi:predicted outer membrane repeat protein
MTGSTETTPLSITGGTFTGSGGIDALSLGGAIYLGNMTNQSLFDGVTFNGLQAQKGGAIYTQGALKIQNNSLIYSNSSTLDGGGIRVDGANAALVIDNSSVYSNTGTLGGGILVENSGTLTVQNGSDIYSNEATDTLGGGIYNTTLGTVTVMNSTIRGNKAKQHGGGLYNSATATLTNVIVSGNAAGTSTLENGGGINNTGTITLMNSTVAGNHGPIGGGLNTTGTATITNSIFWDNAGNSGNEEINGTVTVTYSDVEVTPVYSGTGNINLDPIFVTPVQASSGTPTPAGNFHIQSGSPVINQGTLTGAPSDDIDGDTRTGNPDMGADEYIP